MGQDQAGVDGRIDRVLHFLRQRLTVTAAFLFGSYLTSEGKQYNDIDLAVFAPEVHSMSFSERARVFTDVKLDCDPDVELHLFPESALENARPTNFVGHILATGRRVV